MCWTQFLWYCIGSASKISPNQKSLDAERIWPLQIVIENSLSFASNPTASPLTLQGFVCLQVKGAGVKLVSVDKVTPRSVFYSTVLQVMLNMFFPCFLLLAMGAV